MSKCNSITQEKIKSVLNYNQFTGVFTWKKSTARRIKVGDVAGCVNGEGYISIRIDGVIYLAHRLAWIYSNGQIDDKRIDHINGNRSDNRLENLRLATCSQNMQNQKNAKGYSFQSGKYRSVINVNGKVISLGSFEKEQDARDAYLKAKKKYHEFLPINI